MKPRLQGVYITLKLSSIILHHFKSADHQIVKLISQLLWSFYFHAIQKIRKKKQLPIVFKNSDKYSSMELSRIL